MKIERINIHEIPAVLLGEQSDKLFMAVRGNMSRKDDEVIKILAEEAIAKGYQVLSFDLPEHGEREKEDYLCKVENLNQCDLRTLEQEEHHFHTEHQLEYYRK